jgi:hypothetical protein
MIKMMPIIGDFEYIPLSGVVRCTPQAEIEVLISIAF